MSAPTFRCTADEPPAKPGGMYGAEYQFDASEGLVLDEFVLEDVIHLERLHDRPYCYGLHVGAYRFIVTRRSGKWIARLEEAP